MCIRDREDTDQKRLVEWSIELIIKYYKIFGIEVDEGPFGPDHDDIGQYGPYIQSRRKQIYHTSVSYTHLDVYKRQRDTFKYIGSKQNNIRKSYLYIFQ